MKTLKLLLKVSILISILAFAGKVKSQNIFYREIRINANLNDLNSDHVLTYGGGFEYGFKIKDRYSLSLGLEYNQNNYFLDIHHYSRYQETNINYKVNTLSPLFALGIDARIFSVKLGGAYEYYLSTSKSGKREFIRTLTPPNPDVSQQSNIFSFNNEDFSLDNTINIFLEIQKHFGVKNFNLFISSRYNYFIDPCKNNSENCPPINRSFLNFSLGIIF